jgi:hypothetical protein
VLPWWGWLLFWVVLVGGSALWLGLLVRDVWRRAGALGAEVSRVSEMVAALEARADELREVDLGPVAATQPPHRMREEYRAQRARQRAERRSRRAERLPPWARVD